MKHFNSFNIITLIAVAAISVTSCDDYLTIHPQDRIIEENFWEDRNDLEGVRYAAYAQFGSQIDKLMVWGDLRSDAYKINEEINRSGGQSTMKTYEKIWNAQLDSTMSIFQWGGIYTCINFCNKVLQHGDEVLAKDAQFTSTEWNQMRAEVTAFRALNYFYLIRAFKDIAYSNEIINSDAEVMQFAPTNQLVVLDELINDVEAVKGQARNRYTDNRETKGLMTNTAIYALLADMYLWRSALREGRGIGGWQDDAQKVLEYGQASLDALALQNQQLTSSVGRTANITFDDFDCEDYVNNVQLIENKDMSISYSGNRTVSIPSYSQTFVSGNSPESIFEIQYASSDNRDNGSFGAYFYGPLASDILLKANYEAFLAAHGGNTDRFQKDCRTWYTSNHFHSGLPSSTPSADYFMLKWNLNSFNKDSSQPIPRAMCIADPATLKYQNNWIVYRVPEVLLMMAEAHAVLSTADNDSHVEACKGIVKAIHARAMLDQKVTTTNFPTTSIKNREDCINMVMDERLVELAGEGKRWFDLVRYAERIGGGENPDVREPDYKNGSDGVTKMIDKFLAVGNGAMVSTWKARIRNRYGLYNAIYYEEMMANGKNDDGSYRFPQNPMWDRDRSLVN